MASTYEKIATNTLGTATGTVTFSSISSAYTDLVVIFVGNLNAAATTLLRYNNDSGSNYSQINVIGDGTSAINQIRSNGTSFRLYDVGLSSNNINILIFNFNNYSNTTTYKTTLLRCSDTGGSSEVGMGVSLWRDTSAINRLDFINGGGTWSVGSTFTLYGIKAA
jgi:hypothetical protein